VKKKEDISDLDKELWAEYLKNPKDIFDKEFEGNKLTNRPERYRYDLHGFTLSEANEKVRELINFCQQKGFKEILLITGKGLHSNVDQNAYASKELSKLRFAVPEHIKSQKELSDKVINIDKADIKDGGEGALIIKLKSL
jgi:DNA-nicking Smr family endonuclease|tara:strand:- start:714 stop:1133 length:420 start_codon:yes stop_codon:yes gene_type:complete